MNGNGKEIIAGASSIGQVNIASTSNRFNTPNKAIMFASGYFTLPAKTYFTESDFTISIWVKPTWQTYYSQIVEFGNEPFLDNVFICASSENTGVPYTHIFVSPTYVEAVSNKPLILNTWTHLAFVFERDTMYFYMNGYIVGRKTQAFQARKVSRNKSFIGKSHYSYATNFIGIMDDLRIYHKALTASEILQVMSEQD